ncbi:MAG: ATP-binding protein [Actinomycetota bacterium]|nr:ATP-binding protein [Actinomycetota bacterium]
MVEMVIPKRKEEDLASLTIATNYEHISRAREFVLNLARAAAIGDEAIDDIVLATVEAVTNAIRHANSAYVMVEVSRSSDSIVVRVIDDGRGFDTCPDTCEFPCLEDLGGRGIPLMHHLMDDLSINSEPGKGTEVVLLKKLKGAESGLQRKLRMVSG